MLYVCMLYHRCELYITSILTESEGVIIYTEWGGIIYLYHNETMLVQMLGSVAHML